MSSSQNNYLPKLAIVGRPNVGKSTLFNILTGTRKAVVKDQSGVTRDIMIEPIDVWGKQLDLIDTGGITEADDIFSKMIKEQVSEFLHSVDFIIAIMDGRTGLVPEDRDIIRMVKQTGKPCLLVINKIDSVHEEDTLMAEFHEFGMDIVGASFEQRRGLGTMLEWVHQRTPEMRIEVKEGINIAIVGKPNVGKSSICNFLLGEKRMMVSPIAGTTIDAVDSPFYHNGKKYTLVDTAGLRRSAKREEDLEIISSFKSQEAIRRADLVLLMVDGTEGPSDQDARIMQSILEDHKGVILVANKSDIGNKEIPEYHKTFQAQVDRVFHFFDDVRVVYTSAKTGSGIENLLATIEDVGEKLKFRVSTSELNDFFFQTIRKAPAPVWGTSNVKFYYATQTYQEPPAFICFANHPDGVTNSYRRFLTKNMKEKWGLQGIPIRIFCMKAKRGGENG